MSIGNKKTIFDKCKGWCNDRDCSVFWSLGWIMISLKSKRICVDSFCRNIFICVSQSICWEKLTKNDMNKNYNCSKTLLLSKNNMQHQVYFKPDWIVFSIHEVVTGSEITFGMSHNSKMIPVIIHFLQNISTFYTTSTYKFLLQTCKWM